MGEVHIREEQPRETTAIRSVNERAFGRPDEADLVDALRRAGAVALSLVAEVDGEIVGHILYSPVVIDSAGGAHEAVGLGPMAVVPSQQRHGVGSKLVRASLELLRARGHRAAVVLGHPEYYPRFGFVRASSRGIRWEAPCPDEAFMVLELEPGALPSTGGVVRYRSEFGSV